MLDGNGRLVLDGCKGYVNLPNDLTKALTDVTIISWTKALSLAQSEPWRKKGRICCESLAESFEP
ncbi:MAG: hypothetical protein ABUL62_24090 [Myxococcales bacterium]